MKRLLAPLALLVVTAAACEAYSVKLGMFQGVTSGFAAGGAAFNGYIMPGTFNGTVDFANETVASLFSKFRPWAPDLTVTQSGFADFDGSLTGTAPNFIQVANGQFADVTNGAAANIGNTNLQTSYYQSQYALQPVYIWVSDTPVPSDASVFSIFRADPFKWQATPNVALGFATLVSVDNDGNVVRVRDGGVSFGPLLPPAENARVSFNAGASETPETVGTLLLTVARTGNATTAFTVDFATQNGTALAGSDFTAQNGTLTFAAGNTSQTVSIPIPDRAGFQGNRTFSVALSNIQPPANAEFGSFQTTTVTITDDETPQFGNLTLDNAAYSRAENAGPIPVVVQRIGGTDGAVSARLRTADGTALAGTDYTGVNQTVTFPAGNGTSQTVNIALANDGTFTGNRTFQIFLENPQGGAAVGPISSATATIVEDEAPPSSGSVAFSSAAFSGAENGGPIPITVNRLGGTSGAISVRFATVNGTATSPANFAAANGTLNWPDGDGAPKQFTVTPVNDSVFQPSNLAFSVTLSDPAGGAAIVSPSSATVTIINDDAPAAGTIQFNPNVYTVLETAGTANLTLERTGGAEVPVTVDFATANGTALAGTDFAASGGTITFAANQTTATLPITIIDNAAVDGVRTFSVTLSNATNNATLGANATAAVSIANDDQPATATLGNSAFFVNEGATVSVTVLRGGGNPNGTFTVVYSTANGSAQSGADYTAASGNLVFNPGQTSQTVPVPTLTDTAAEDEEVFFFTLRQPVPPDPGLRLVDPTRATITIARNSGGLDQPDLTCAAGSGSFVGAGVFNSTGDGQIQSLNGSPGSTLTFRVRVKNVGPIRDSVLLKGTASGTAGGSSVTYEHDGQNITSAISSSAGYRVSGLRAGQSAEITVKVKLGSNAPPLSGYGATIQGTSIGTSSKLDTVRVLGITR